MGYMGGSTNRGGSIPDSAKTAQLLLSEVNKKLRTVDETLCCKLQVLVDKLDLVIEASGGTPTPYNEQNIYQTTPGNAFNIQGYFVNIHSISITVVGDAGQFADITIGGFTVHAPVGFTTSYEATGYLTNTMRVEDTSTASVIVSVIGIID